MLKPSIDKLLVKVDSKYSLVVATARRARIIKASGEDMNVKNKSKKPVSIALEEILNDQLKFRRIKEGDIK